MSFTCRGRTCFWKFVCAFLSFSPVKGIKVETLYSFEIAAHKRPAQALLGDSTQNLIQCLQTPRQAANAAS